MKQRILSVPELGFIVATRAMLGAGLGLLLSDRVTSQQRRAVGWTLVAIGMVTTIPAAMAVFGNDDRYDE